MIRRLEEELESLKSMKKYPKELFYKGDLSLLNREKISIVGSRRPNQYARELTHQLAVKLAQSGVCVVSGGAIGTDIIAHKAAGAQNTIMVAGTGLDKYYPAINKKVIQEIEKEGLVLSQFAEGTPSQRYNFPLRNELVVALGEVLVVMYADLNSGTMHSVEFALKMGKKVFVLPHRLGESEATNKLLQENKAEAIYDIDAFVAKFSKKKQKPKEEKADEFLEFCKTNPTYEAALKKFPGKVFEAELMGLIKIHNGLIYPI